MAHFVLVGIGSEFGWACAAAAACLPPIGRRARERPNLTLSDDRLPAAVNESRLRTNEGPG